MHVLGVGGVHYSNHLHVKKRHQGRQPHAAIAANKDSGTHDMSEELPLHLLCMRNPSVGDSHRGPLKNKGKPTFFRKNANTNKFTSPKHAQHNRDPGGPSGPPKQLAHAPSGETPRRSRACRPLGRGPPHSRAPTGHVAPVPAPRPSHLML
jgi:hypothetical protein